MAKRRRFETTFAIYEAYRTIGEGGTGVVYKCRDEAGNVYALKCLVPDRITTERLKRFKNEISFCLQPPHPAIIRVMDHGFVEKKGKKCPFYVMTRYPQTLRGVIGKKLEPSQTLAIFSKILDGVEAAHMCQVWHRDIKPENILCDESAQSVVIADFGIAHFAPDLQETEVVTNAGSRLANLRYSAPEQRQKRVPVNASADLFSLGLILNELFTKEVPQGTGFKTIRSVAPEFAYLDDVVEKLVRQNPSERYANVDEIKRELIARNIEFVAQQRLDVTKRQVIPKFQISDPLIDEPVQVVAVEDYNNRSLTVKLSTDPNTKWKQWFRKPDTSFSSTESMYPNACTFNGTQVTFPASENNAQRNLDMFKSYVKFANESYRQRVMRETQEEERRAREELQRRTQQEEERSNVLKSLQV